MRIRNIFPVGTTGNATSPAIELDGDPDDIALNFEVEGIGATPTVTFLWQGSVVGGANAADWFPFGYITDASSTESFAARIVTAVGSFLGWRSSPLRRYRFIRCVVSANTNVTYHADIIEFD